MVPDTTTSPRTGRQELLAALGEVEQRVLWLATAIVTTPTGCGPTPTG